MAGPAQRDGSSAYRLVQLQGRCLMSGNVSSMMVCMYAGPDTTTHMFAKVSMHTGWGRLHHHAESRSTGPFRARQIPFKVNTSNHQVPQYCIWTRASAARMTAA